MKRLVKRRSASDKVTAHLTIGGNPVAPNPLVAADLNARSDSINVKKKLNLLTFRSTRQAPFHIQRPSISPHQLRMDAVEKKGKVSQEAQCSLQLRHVPRH